MTPVAPFALFRAGVAQARGILLYAEGMASAARLLDGAA
jgi:hypothetical protein